LKNPLWTIFVNISFYRQRAASEPPGELFAAGADLLSTLLSCRLVDRLIERQSTRAFAAPGLLLQG
jgi:hypothetical protein